jgi:hypothetical protein
MPTCESNILGGSEIETQKDSLREREREREREKNKSGLKISNWQELGGFISVHNFLQAP